MFVEMVDVFGPTILPRPADANEVKHTQVLDVFTESNATAMWADGDVEFGGQQ
jgi:hypothetical protein